MGELFFFFIRLADIKNNNAHCRYCWDLYSIYYLPDAILTCLHLIYPKKTLYEEGTLTTLIVQMQRLRFREAMQLAQGHTGIK